jgi:acetyltransferase-like isoleucine patch superfamily enzyme
VGINTNAGTRPGCYLQGNGGIYIGNYVHFASNIGVISGNHDLNDQTKHKTKEVRIGDYTWIGMGAIILPGVILGTRTIVGAGSVVTKSFPNGYCVIAGNPARLIKTLDPSEFKPTKFRTEYYGYIPKEMFGKWSKKHLSNNQYIQ